MNSLRSTLTLDQPVTYQVEVCGEVNEDWSDWVGAAAIRRAGRPAAPVTIITGTFDQAALHGLLRRLYSLGFPLLSVNRVASRHRGDQNEA